MPYVVSYDADEPQFNQTANWTCSACSLAWLNRALSIDHATDEWSAVDYIGQPANINADWGLMNASGARLVECLREQGAPAFSGWLDYPSTYELAFRMPLLIGGVAWNHWVGVRRGEDYVLHLANSAPGWMNIDQELREGDFFDLGPFAVIAVPLSVSFPPLPQTQP